MWLRHANPWSFWTRWAAFPLFGLAVWSRVWIGWWAAGAVALVAIWLALNPFAFAPVTHARRWESRAILGERIWFNNKKIPIPAHHHRIIRLNLALSAVCLVPFITGLIWLNLPLTLSANLSIFIVGLWFADRMAWVFDDMIGAYPEYRDLTRGDAAP